MKNILETEAVVYGAGRNGNSPNPEVGTHRRFPPVIRERLAVDAAVLDDLLTIRADAESVVRELTDPLLREQSLANEQESAQRAAMALQIESLKTELDAARAADSEQSEIVLTEEAAVEAEARQVRERLIAEIDADLKAEKEALAARTAAFDRESAEIETAAARWKESAVDARSAAGFAASEALLDSPTTDLEVFASDDRRVLDPEHAHPVHPAVLWTITVVSGIAAGVSLGLAARLIHADTLHRELYQIVACAGFGIATSACVKYGLDMAWREVSARWHGNLAWRGAAAATLTLTLLLIAIYSTVERNGLMAGMNIDAATQNIRSRQAPDPAAELKRNLIATFGSLFLTFGYVWVNAYIGWSKGQYRVNHAYALSKQTHAAQAEEGRRRQNSRVQEALRADGHLQEQLKRLAGVEAKWSAWRVEAQARIADLEARKRALIETSLVLSGRHAEARRQREQLAEEQQRLRRAIAEWQERKGNVGSSRAAGPIAIGRKAAESEAQIAAARYDFEQEQARTLLRLMSGNVLQRIMAALTKRRPAAGTLQYQIGDSQG